MNSDNNKNPINIKINFGGTLFIVFLILKLVGVINWSWWWVTAPIWIPASFYLGIISIIGVAFGVKFLYDVIEDKIYEIKINRGRKRQRENTIEQKLQRVREYQDRTSSVVTTYNYSKQDIQVAEKEKIDYVIEMLSDLNISREEIIELLKTERERLQYYQSQTTEEKGQSRIYRNKDYK